MSMDGDFFNLDDMIIKQPHTMTAKQYGVWQHGRLMGSIYIILIIVLILILFIIVPLMVAIYIFEFDLYTNNNCGPQEPPEISVDDFDF